MRLTDLDQRATSQHGLITLTQSGLSRAGWYRAVRSGRFEQTHPGVARLAGTPRTYRQRIAAADGAPAPNLLDIAADSCGWVR